MNDEQKLKNQSFLSSLMASYDNYIASDEGTCEPIEDNLSAFLTRLFDLYSIEIKKQLDLTYYDALEIALKDLFEEYSAYVRRNPGTARVERQQIGKFARILELHSQRNSDLQKTLFPKVLSKLDNLKKVELDYLDKTNKLTSENTHSDILAALIDRDRCPGICSTFLANLLNAALFHSPNFDKTVKLNSGKQEHLSDVVKKMIKYLEAGKLYTTCVREKSIYEGMRIDILVKCRMAYIAIENKVHSYEHDAQTVKYYEWLQENCVGKIVPLGILLSPTRMSPVCSHFGILGYEDVKWSLVNALSTKNINNEEYLLGRSYLNSLEHLLI